MSLGQTILDAVKADRAATDALSNSVTALSATVTDAVAGIERLIASGGVSPEQAAEIIGTLKSDQATAEAALQTSIAAGQALVDELGKLPPVPTPAGDPAPTP